jgi:biopolymer transport protein TolR
MLVLLIIFMVTAPLLSQGVKINLPQAQAKALEEKNKDPIIITVDANGRYFLNIADKPDQPLAVADLANRVAAELQLSRNQGQPRNVFVKGDKAVDYGKVVQAMVLLQQAGAEDIGLMTQSPNLDDSQKNYAAK